jgi:dTDP-glucose 4,6-dehydratase
MNVLMTGACGFIGSHTFNEFINQGLNVVVVDKLTYASNINNIDLNRCSFYQTDIIETEKINQIVERHEIDTIINLAAETHVDNSIKDTIPFVRSNIEGVLSLLNVCKKHNIKLVQISTDEVYGPAEGKPFSENDNLNPMNPYAATKAAADHLISSFHNTHKVVYQIIRPSNNFGPNQNEEKFIPKVLKSIKEMRKIPVYGDGNQRRQWTFVKDTASSIFEITMNYPDNKIYNVGDNNIMTNNDLLNRILSMTNTSKELIQYVEDRPGHDRMYWIQNSEMNKIAEPKFRNFEASLTETIRTFYDKN